ncbi:sensor histidine kinase [Microaceticoccus formicicus]|uniref:sensor histidine kinase n=1 Tax=Microaceticoccus formicicus TaxID=3118105 RepID=UPI003CD03EF2|nr:GHKL domain-containing protein [Peptoniphilaceae bacterium AMB_02]
MIILTLFVIALSIIFETIVYFGMDSLFGSPYEYYFLPGFFSNVLFLLAIITLKRIKFIGNFTKTLKVSTTTLLFIFITLIYAISSVHFLLSKGLNLSILFNILIVILSYIVIFNYIHVKTIKDNYQHENDLLELSIKNKKEYYELIESQNTEVRKIKHDLKNRLISVLQSDETKREELIGEIIGELDITSLIPHTKNISMNLLLNQKLKRIEVYPKQLEVFCDIPEEVPMKDDDLTVILGNLLDNTVESLIKQDVEERYLQIDIRKERYFLKIRIENSYEGLNDLKTSKDDKTNHGFGIKSVLSIVESYSGYLDIQQEDRFSITISLPIFLAA